MKVYLVCTNDLYELPVYVAHTLKNASQWLGIPWETLRSALKRKGVYKGKKFTVEVVQIDR